MNCDKTDRFHSMEFTLTKRASDRWMGAGLLFRRQEPPVALRQLLWRRQHCHHESERRVLPARRNLVVGRQYHRDLSPAIRHLGVRIPPEQERRERAAHLYLPHCRSRRRSVRSQTTATRRFASSRTGASNCPRYNILNFRANKDFRMTGGRRIRHRLRHLQPAEFRDADRRRIRVRPDVRLCHRRDTAAHYADRRAVHVLEEGRYETTKSTESWPSPRLR